MRSEDPHRHSFDLHGFGWRMSAKGLGLLLAGLVILLFGAWMMFG